MADLVIPIREYIGKSEFNWETWEMEWGTNVDDVRMMVEYAQYQGQTIDKIILEIGTCFGGGVYAGIDVFNYVRGLGIPVKTRVSALAASMGTIIALAGDEIELEQTAQFMIHGPSGGADGTLTDLKSALTSLENCNTILRDMYVARTGQPVEVVEEWMSKDTWLTAAQCLSLGLATTVVTLAPVTATKPTEAQANARRAKFAGIVARADKRISPAAAVAGAVPSPSPKPAMTKVAAKPTPRAAAPKPTPKPVAKKSIGQRILAALGIDEDDEEPTAELQSTELDNGAFLYHDGALAVDTAVFNDEAMTEATGDGDYDAKDGSVISVAGGIVSAIEAPAAEGEEGSTTASSDDLLARIEKLEQKDATAQKTITDLKAKVEKFEKAVPPTPAPRARAAGAPQVDPKKPESQARATSSPFA